MISIEQARRLQGSTLYGAGQTKIGTIHELYADRADGEPTFATVKTGMLGKTHFVPLSAAEVRGDDVHVPYDKDLVSNAPSINEDAELSPQEEDRLYQHYGLMGTGMTGTTTGTTTDTTTGMGAGTAAGTAAGTTGGMAGAGHDTSGPNTDDAMTRSEERLQVGTQKQETGRARLRKYVVTDTEQVNVPVTKERVTLEREPITDANVGQAMDGPAISEEEHEVTLTEERPVVAKETVPVERVRMGKEATTENVTVSEDVRKEQIEADNVYPDDATGDRSATRDSSRTT